MTGAYIEKGREDEMIAHYFSKFSDSTKLAMLNELEESNAKIQAELDKAKPKAEKWDMFLDELWNS